MCGLGVPGWPPVSGVLTCCVLDSVWMLVMADKGQDWKDRLGP